MFGFSRCELFQRSGSRGIESGARCWERIGGIYFFEREFQFVPPPPPAPGWGTRRGHPERPPLLVQVPGPTPRVVRIRRKGAPGQRNASGSKEEEFMPWVPADSEEPQDLEEEERRERMTRLLDCYAANKRKRQVVSNSESDPAPV